MSGIQQKCNLKIYKHITIGRSDIAITAIKVRIENKWLNGKCLEDLQKTLMLSRTRKADNSPD